MLNDRQLILLMVEKACILVTLAFVLTRTPLFAHLLQRRLSFRDKGIAVVLLLAMGLAEVKVPLQPSYETSLRIVAAAVAGLLAGPAVGLVIGLAVTGMAFQFEGLAPVPIGVSMVVAGLAGGAVRSWDPRVASLPITGFVLGLVTSLFRDLLAHPGLPAGDLLAGAIAHGVSVALILLVMEQVRQQQKQARAAAMFEVDALRARMDPHFLFNSLNTLSALSSVSPELVPDASARLGVVLRASFNQADRTLIRLDEELDVIRAFLGVEELRFGDRLSAVFDICPGLSDELLPPFILQPLVENAIRHGIEPSRSGGVVRISASIEGDRLILSVSDNGIGISSTGGEQLFLGKDGHTHALELLHCRLQHVYGKAFRLSVVSATGKGTTVTLALPRRGKSLVEQHSWDEGESLERAPMDRACISVILGSD